MGKRNRTKKGKTDAEKTNTSNKGPVVTTDPRFSKIHSDPRFLKPKFNDNKVKVDERFKGIFDDNMGFKYTAKVDKYGRKQKNDTKEDLKKFYKFESDEDSEKTLKNVEKDSSKSGESEFSIESEEDSEEDSDEDVDSLDPEQKKELIFARSRGEALIGSDSGSEVDDYSTEEEFDEFDETYAGIEQEDIPRGEETYRFAAMNMDWDNVKAKDLFKVFNSVKPETGTLISVSIYPSEFGKERMEMENTLGPPKEIFENPDKHEADSDEELNNEDDGAEFNQEQLRKYQIDRLKYYYAVVECDSVATAKAIYDICDGDEFESTANFFDLRFIPDDMVFEETPRDVATEDPIEYKSANFVTSALTNSRVDLTWDQDDPERVRLIQRSFTEKDLDEMNFDTLLGSDSDSDENTELREKYLNLIKGASDNESDNSSDQEMEITFTPGLSEMNNKSLDQKSESSENDASDDEKPEETTIEKYKRKTKERKQAKIQAKMNASTENMVKSENMTKKELQALKDRENAELELVMMDNTPDSKQHFDMKQVLKAEKKSGRKGRNKKKIDSELTQDDFKIDVNDSRFAALYTSHNFAIDPTNPHFKKTNAMKELLSERQKKHADISELNDSNNSKPKAVADSTLSSKKELANLVNSVKRKAENFKAPSIKKSKN